MKENREEHFIQNKIIIQLLQQKCKREPSTKKTREEEGGFWVRD